MTYKPNPRNSPRPQTAEKLSQVLLKTEPDYVELSVVTTSRCYPVAYYYILKAKPVNAYLAFQKFQLLCIPRLGEHMIHVIAMPGYLELHFRENRYIRLTCHDLPTSKSID